MNCLSIISEDKIKVVIESYLIENILQLDNDTIQRLTPEKITVKYENQLFNVLYKIFIHKYFAKFSISNKYIDKSDIVEILRYCKIKYTTIECGDYSPLMEWWREDLNCDDDFDISYIISWFVYSYMFDNKKYIIELINKLCNTDTYVVLK